MKEKVIYLDFDGVINNNMTPKINIVNRFGYENIHIGISSELLEKVNQIFDATGAVIWVHSSWRGPYDEKTISKLLLDNGLRAPYKGNIPYLYNRLNRGLDIRRHIESNAISNYVILDDLPSEFFEEQDRPFHIMTSYICGIQNHNVEMAIHLLNNTNNSV